MPPPPRLHGRTVPQPQPDTMVPCSRCDVATRFGDMCANDETGRMECPGCYLIQADEPPAKPAVVIPSRTILSTPYNIFLRETYAEYRELATEYVTSHQLEDFRFCPASYYKKMMRGNPQGPDMPAFQFGRAFHTLALEGEEVFRRDYVVGGPINPTTQKPYGKETQKYAEWQREQGGKTCIAVDEFNQMLQMRTSILAHDTASALLLSGQAECVIRTQYAGWNCQARLDWISGAPDMLWSNRFIVDLKTCGNLDYFEDDAKRYGYHQQLAFYHSMLESAIGRETNSVPFLIAVEKQDPYRCGVWRMSDRSLDAAKCNNKANLARMADCVRASVWPTGFEIVREL